VDETIHELTLTNMVPGMLTTREETPYLFCSGPTMSVAVNDPNPADPMQVTLSVTPGSGKLTLTSTIGLTFTASGNGTATMTFHGTVGAINMALMRLVFSPAQYFNGHATLSITSQELDSSGHPVPGVTATNTVPITVTPINHPPTVVGPATLATTKNVPVTFSSGHGNAITLGDPDVNPAVQIEQLTLSAAGGKVTLATTAGLTFVTGNGTGTVTVRGTINALNAAVNGLVFTPSNNFVGTAHLVVTLNDLANTVGPAMQSAWAITIPVT